MVNSWKITSGKGRSGKSSDAQVTALTGGSSSYIAAVNRVTGALVPEPRALPQQRRHSHAIAAAQSENNEQSEIPKAKFNIESFISRVYM